MFVETSHVMEARGTHLGKVVSSERLVCLGDSLELQAHSDSAFNTKQQGGNKLANHAAHCHSCIHSAEWMGP